MILCFNVFKGRDYKFQSIVFNNISINATRRRLFLSRYIIIIKLFKFAINLQITHLMFSRRLTDQLTNGIANAKPPVPILKPRLELRTVFGFHRGEGGDCACCEEGEMLRYYMAERVQRLSISIVSTDGRWI